MLIRFRFSRQRYEEVSPEWWVRVSPLLWEWGGAGCAALATLAARVCGRALWWGPQLADTLAAGFCAVDAPPLPLDR